MEPRSSSEATSSSATEEFPQHLVDPMVQYYVHMSPLLVPILSQMNPVYDTPIKFPNIHFNIILLPMSTSS
jgi:hypothetical protein